MPDLNLDKTDLAILKLLQEDAKISNVQLAKRVHLSPSPCLTRVRRLEQLGIVSRHVALLSPQSLGLNVSVFAQITLEKQAKQGLDRFESAIRERPEVMECYLMTGEADYLIRVLVRDVEALEQFIVKELTRIPGIANIRSSVALKQVKYETALPLSAIP